MISAEYGKSGVKGEQYIKKIIQIPIVIPQWDIDDVKILVHDLLDREIIPRGYHDILAKNIDSITKTVEHNPREVKRFINNFIVAYEIFSRDTRIDPARLLILQAISVRWDCFYRLLINSTKELRDKIYQYSECNEGERAFVWDPKKVPEEAGRARESFRTVTLDEEQKRILGNFKSDYELWQFIRENGKGIFDIDDWAVYRRATEAVKEDYTGTKIRNELAQTSEMVRDFLYGLQAYSQEKMSTGELQQRSVRLKKQLVSVIEKKYASQMIPLLTGILLDLDVLSDILIKFESEKKPSLRTESKLMVVRLIDTIKMFDDYLQASMMTGRSPNIAGLT